MADDNTDDCGKDEAASLASASRWNTYLLRTNLSSLDSAMFSEQEEKVGEGETYLVERCIVANQVVTVKHIKTNRELDDRTSHRRLRAVILELQILGHRPLWNHPNFPFAFGYGWNMNGGQVIPYLLVEYAPKRTLRQYVKSMSPSIPLRDLQISAGDVASALSALHTCGNDRPAQALAKLTDFGHALVINKSSKHDGIMRYGGTYNAPEVYHQDTFSIDRDAMPQCDVWAFGLLIWELCLLGEDHLSYSRRKWPEVGAQVMMQRLNPADARRYAMASVPGKVEYVFIRATLHYTLQEDPTKRIAHLEALPLLTEWNGASISGLESELAFHLDSPSPTYEMFRPENGREILWKHEEQIFQALERAHSKKHAKDKASVSWRSLLSATTSALLKVKNTRTLRACFDGDSKTLESLLSQQEGPNSSTLDGCTIFHWFFMLEDSEATAQILKSMYEGLIPLHVDLPFSRVWKAHDQWPLQLLGTPLGMAISVNSLLTVKALLALGATAIRKVQSLRMALLSGMTAFTQAIDFQDYDVVAALLRAEPKLASCQLASVEDPAVFNLPTHLAAQLAARRDVPEALYILQLINDYAKDLNADKKPPRDHLDMTPLHLAVTGTSSRAARWILEQQTFLLDVEDKLGRTALHCCASKANLEFLLSKGTPVMHTDKYGMTTLHRACFRGELGLVRYLLKHDQPLGLMNNKYGPPLHCAIINGSIDVVMALLEAGAPIEKQDHKGNTPIHVAVRMGRYTILKHLLKRGGNRCIRNSNGRNPENLASIIGTTDNSLFLETADGMIASFGRFPQGTNGRESPIPDFAWDTNDVGHEALLKGNTSNLDKAGTVDDEELPAFPDGRREKNRLLEKLPNATINDVTQSAGYDLRDLYEGVYLTTATRLRAQIIPYLDDSIWQDNEPSAVHIGKILAQTAFNISKITRICNAWGKTPPTYKEFEDHMELAINQTLKIMQQVRPNWVVPGRSQQHVEKMSTCEVARMQLTSDTSDLDALLNKAPIPKAHPILKDSSTSEDRRTKLNMQKIKWLYEREIIRP
ncbi:hypothetical protein THAR02_05588 [Trichoderma harzianum]|uniref:Protein kinase domain-containing protein n=1 Tax=Trichoderma harzianum TaxID=5544 RepID=A0A0F9XCK0_TRIHA|nr:hypothetical protein THAR02_05588 [Trichoderma harzianum]